MPTVSILRWWAHIRSGRVSGMSRGREEIQPNSSIGIEHGQTSQREEQKEANNYNVTRFPPAGHANLREPPPPRLVHTTVMGEKEKGSAPLLRPEHRQSNNNAR